MPLSGTADLLFRIAGDASPGVAELGAFRSAVKETVGELVTGGKAAGESMAHAAQEGSRGMAHEVTEAKHALHALGEETGLHMPRFVRNWIASMAPVAGIMSAAFSPLAALGLLEVLKEIPETFEKGIARLHGWNDETKKVFEESTKVAMKFQVTIVDVHEKLRAIGLIGKEGAEKWNAEMAINRANIGELVKRLDELSKKRGELNDIIHFNPADHLKKTTKYDVMTGRPYQAVAAEEGPSADKVEKAKIQLKELEPVIESLSDRLTELNVHSREIAAGAAEDAVRRSREEFRGLSELLTEIQGKMAAATSEDAKIAAEIGKLQADASAKLKELQKLQAEGKLPAGVIEREKEASKQALELIPQLYQKMTEDLAQKRRIAGEEAHAELVRRLEGEQEQTVEARERGWNAEMDKLTATLEKEKLLTAANVTLVAAIRKAGIDKIRREQEDGDRIAKLELQTRLAEEQQDALTRFRMEMARLREEYRQKHQLTAENEAILAALQKAGEDKIAREQRVAFDTQMAALHKHLTEIEGTHQTGEERIRAQYKSDVEAFVAAEEKKAQAAAVGEAQRATVARTYEAIRAALLQRESADLQALRNSRGWQGVFGNEFGQLIRGNEALVRDWAASTNQSLLMVRVTMEGLAEEGRRAFGSLAQGMGQNIASAFIYRKSVGEAMREAAAATLESLAAESLTYAIYSTALGFLRLAQHDIPGATSAFTSAAIWAAVGGVAAVAGRAIAPQQAAGAAGAGGGAGAAAGGGAGSSAGAGPAGNVPQITIVVQGHIYGNADAVIDAINDAVLNRDKALYATKTTQGGTVYR